jgi:hypothetical protein
MENTVVEATCSSLVLAHPRAKFGFAPHVRASVELKSKFECKIHVCSKLVRVCVCVWMLCAAGAVNQRIVRQLFVCRLSTPQATAFTCLHDAVVADMTQAAQRHPS